jgi:hypothetical protein
MGYFLADIFMIAVEIYFSWKDRSKSWKERDEKPLPRIEKPLPKIVGSVPYVPLKKSPSSGR